MKAAIGLTGTCEGKLRYDSGGIHTRNSFYLLQTSLIKGSPLRIRAVPRFRQGCSHGQNILRPEASIDSLKTNEAPDQQARTD